MSDNNGRSEGKHDMVMWPLCFPRPLSFLSKKNEERRIKEKTKRNTDTKGYLPVGVTVLARWCPVGSPACVGNTSMGLECFLKVRFTLRDELFQFHNFPDFLESTDFFLLVTIYGESRGVIATVFKSRESCSLWKRRLSVDSHCVDSTVH